MYEIDWSSGDLGIAYTLFLKYVCSTMDVYVNIDDFDSNMWGRITSRYVDDWRNYV